MKVKELMQWLFQCNPEANIYISGDGEGNSHSNPGDIWTDDDLGFYILYPDDSYLEFEDLK